VLSGRILALDYGTKNVGLASSDETGSLVCPLPSIPNQGRRDLLHQLQAAVRNHDIRSLVIGLPLNMDGSEGDAVRRVRRLAQQLKEKCRLPVQEVDERLSSIEASAAWHRMSSRQRRKYRTSDSLAAAFILERYLKEA
jgi:putative Holliday junction resolvase